MLTSIQKTNHVITDAPSFTKKFLLRDEVEDSLHVRSIFSMNTIVSNLNHCGTQFNTPSPVGPSSRQPLVPSAPSPVSP